MPRLHDERLPGRFWMKVTVRGDCWLWNAKLKRRYGYFVFDGRAQRAHRVAYEQLVGGIPDGMELDHLCREPSCVNPAHLEPATHAENMARGAHALKTHCPHGHPYDAENTYVYDGRRFCRACAARRVHEFHRRKAQNVCP